MYFEKYDCKSIHAEKCGWKDPRQTVVMASSGEGLGLRVLEKS